MAGLLPSFSSGSNLHIRMGGVKLAFITNLSFSDDVSTGAVGGIGSYSYDAVEPLQYAARGSFTVTRYTKEALNAIYKNGDVNKQFSPGRVNAKTALIGSKNTAGTVKAADNGDGNSMLAAAYFSPIRLMFSKSFDIIVTERTGEFDSPAKEKVIFSCLDCRLTSYAIGFTPGSLVSENLGFICIRVQDEVALASSGVTVGV